MMLSTYLRGRKMALKILLITFLLTFFLLFVVCYKNVPQPQSKMVEVYSWKQIGYDYYGTRYTNDSDYRKNSGPVNSTQELNDSEKYFIQYNNVPVGLALYEWLYDPVITIPRRRYGIPSTINSVSGPRSHSPLLTPFPEPPNIKDLVSVYRPAIDRCHRFWALDTGLIEAPGARRQVQPPSIVIYDLKSHDGTRILKYELKPTDLVNERTSGGLTSISVEVDSNSCEIAYAYINDLATDTLIVFSLKDRDSWSFSHPSFKHDPSALNFTSAGFVIPWKDGIFSTALGDTDAAGRRKLYFHPMASTKEFSVYTDELKKKGNKELSIKLEGDKGPNTQSGTHSYHPGTRTLFFAGLAQDAIFCWNVDKPLIPENVGIADQDHKKLVYISDLRVAKDEVWVLVNQMPRFVFSKFDTNEDNFFLLRGNVSTLIKGTPCEA